MFGATLASRKLRPPGASQNKPNIFWRGVKNASVDEDFMNNGGTESAPMSTTTKLKIALEYSASTHPILMRLKPETFLESGASVAFLSCFPPGEKRLFLNQRNDSSGVRSHK